MSNRVLCEREGEGEGEGEGGQVRCSIFLFFPLLQPQEISLDHDLAVAVQSAGGKDNPDGPATSYVREFFILLAICNTVVASRKRPLEQVNSERKQREEADTSSKADCCQVPRNQGLSTPPLSSLPILTSDGLVNHALSPSPKKTNCDDGISSLSDAVAASVDHVVYEAESPDEAALVKVADAYGFRLLSRCPESVTVFIPGEGKVTFEVLKILAFDSARKRMSVVVRHPDDGSIVLYCKGADSAVLNKLSPSNRSVCFRGNNDMVDGAEQTDSGLSLREETVNHLNVYARDGLRTLCMARRVGLHTSSNWEPSLCRQLSSGSINFVLLRPTASTLLVVPFGI